MLDVVDSGFLLQHVETRQTFYTHWPDIPTSWWLVSNNSPACVQHCWHCQQVSELLATS